MFLNKIRNIFCVPDTKFVSATNVARAGKRGNICVGNNVSSFARAFTENSTRYFLCYVMVLICTVKWSAARRVRVAAKKTRHINLQQSILICNAHLMAINKVALCVVKTEINTNRTNINKAKIAQNKTRESRKLTFVI